MIKIYNTMTAKKEDFIPCEENTVSMYVCGPTVYNFLHIGNMRCYVVFDCVRRYFEYRGYTVKMAQNFTDVDDRIITRSEEEGISAQEVADKYIAEAFADYQSVGVKKAEFYPRVTEEMAEIVEMIAQLIENGFAYESGGHVFYDAKKFKNYGKLSKKNVDDLIAGARVEVNEHKRSPVDFVLWKPSKKGEPYWDSPWGNGRPGWHIECSAMTRKYLGKIDIHGGGADLIFPHHENEIAQSEALQQEPLARYWMHNGMLTNEHKKMSKSLGNFFTYREVSKIFSPDVIRFFLLSGHYRMPMEFSEELLKSAERALDRIVNCRSLLAETADGVLPPEAENFKTEFCARMDDDFNTADAIAVIFELVRYCNKLMADGKAVNSFTGLIDELCGVLGVRVSKEKDDIDAEIENLIEKRNEARKNKDWAAADKIRDDLTAMGIVLEDTASGVRWTRK